LENKEANPAGPRWKHRRRLVYAATGLAFFMILFGLATFWWDRQVSTEAIVSGTAILTVVLGAYLGTATWDDVRLYREPMHADFTEDPE
jgi:DMSO/TMAO reductase YedYZ heme-binding membrane subunit